MVGERTTFLMTRTAIAIFVKLASMSARVPPTKRFRFVSSMTSGSTSTYWPTPMCASCCTTCEPPPPKPTMPTLTSWRLRSLLMPKKLWRSCLLMMFSVFVNSSTDLNESGDVLRPGLRCRPEQAARVVVAENNQAVRHARQCVEESRDELACAAQVRARELRATTTAVVMDVEHRRFVGVGRLDAFSHGVRSDLGAHGAASLVVFVGDGVVAAT